VPPVGERDHVMGRPDAKLTVIEYGDFGCPHCFAAKLPIESLLRRYDDLRLVWRHLPDPELHPGADLAAELSELAASHGRFWDAYSLLLAGRSTFSNEELLAVAGTLELEEAETALADRTYRDRVEVDQAGGEGAGARGTPTFFIDGKKVTGHWRQLAEIVPSALSFP
jgi:protein-disulfide isomerase